MSPELARAITIASVVMTVLAICFAVFMAFRPSRVRPRRDVLMLLISLTTIVVLGFIMRIVTPLAFAVGAIGVGAGLGLMQGARVQIEDRGGVFFARRDVLGLAAWGVGLAITQLAGLASRGGVIEAGQAVSLLGIAATGTLLATRQRELVKARASVQTGTAVAAMLPIALVLGVVLFQQQEPPIPEPITYRGEVDWAGASDDFLNVGSVSGIDTEGADLSGTYQFSNVEVTFLPDTGDAFVGGELQVGWPMGEFNYGLVLGFATFLDDEISEKDQAEIDAAAAERDCTVSYRFVFSTAPSPTVDGTFDASATIRFESRSGALESDCSFIEEFDLEELLTFGAEGRIVLSGLGSEQISGEIQGVWQFDTEDEVELIPNFSWPFTADADSLPEDEEAVVDESDAADRPAGGEEDPGDGEFSEDDFDDIEDFDADLGEDEVSDEEAAAAAMVGAGGAIVVAGMAIAGAAGSAPPGGPGGNGGNGRGRRPRPGRPITDGEAAIEQIRSVAETRGETAILDALERLGRKPDGSPDIKELERIRDALRRRTDLGDYEASSELHQSGAVGDFVRGARDDVAGGLETIAGAAKKVADAMEPYGPNVLSTPVRGVEAAGKIGAWATKNPGTVARVVIAVKTVGISEIGFVGKELVDSANTPGDESMGGAAKEIAWVAGRETATNLIGAGIGKGLGAAAKGLGAGASEAAEAAAREGIEELGEAAARETAETTLGTAVREGIEETGEAAAREGAEATMGTAVREGAEETGEAAAREGAEAAGKETAEEGAESVAKQSEAPAPPREQVDDTWLNESDHGTKIPREKINQAGYTEDQADALRKVAEEENVLLGSRATNVDSLNHPDAIPKPVGVKGKTIQDLDVQLGAKEGDQGLAGMFKPNDPGEGASRELVDRYNQRLAEFNKLQKQLPALEQQGIFWDEGTGLFKNADGVPYRGDIDLVYIKDAKTGQYITGDRYDSTIAKLQASGAQVQHGAEQSVVRDLTRAGGDVGDAMGLHSTLSGGHITGAETVIETSGGGWRKGATPFGMYDRVTGTNPLSRGLPMDLPEG